MSEQQKAVRRFVMNSKKATPFNVGDKVVGFFDEKKQVRTISWVSKGATCRADQGIFFEGESGFAFGQGDYDAYLYIEADA